MADASTKVVSTSQITHIGSGASIAAGGLSVSADVSTALSFSGNLARYPRCDVVLSIAPTASIALASCYLNLYRREMAIDGANNAAAPGASNKRTYVGTFQVAAATVASTTHYTQLTDIPLSGTNDCQFYLENTLAVNIPAGWTLKITPKTDVGATD
jgi:hypothetical protein